MTLTAQILSAPIINGTPTGSGVATVMLKRGTGTADYSTTSTTLTAVDSTYLAHSIVVPVGWKLIVDARGSISVSTGVASVYAAILDGGEIVNSVVNTPSAISLRTPFSVQGVIVGDNATHNIRMAFRTTNAADAAVIFNSTINAAVPTLLLTLLPAN